MSSPDRSQHQQPATAGRLTAELAATCPQNKLTHVHTTHSVRTDTTCGSITHSHTMPTPQLRQNVRIDQRGTRKFRASLAEKGKMVVDVRVTAQIPRCLWILPCLSGCKPARGFAILVNLISRWSQIVRSTYRTQIPRHFTELPCQINSLFLHTWNDVISLSLLGFSGGVWCKHGFPYRLVIGRIKDTCDPPGANCLRCGVLINGRYFKLHTIFENMFSLMKTTVIQTKFHWNMFLRV